MASLNKVMLIGNLTRDPEVRYLPSGAAVADLRLAVSRKYKASSGEMKEETCFVNVSAWGRTAETCGQYLSKGSPLLVEGRLKLDEWEKDGQKQSRLSVVAERAQFLPKGGSGGGSPEKRAPADSKSAADEDEGAGLAADDDDVPF